MILQYKNTTVYNYRYMYDSHIHVDLHEGAGGGKNSM